MNKMYLKVFRLLLLGALVLLMGGLVGAPVAADPSPFTVRVQSDDGRAISGVTIEVLAAGSGIVVASGVTDNSGQVSFELDAGSYRLRVSSGSLYFSSEECGPKRIYNVPQDTSATVTLHVSWMEGELPTNRPPVVTSVTANPSQLWPPNHKAVDVTISVDATDPDGDEDIVRITYSVADEYGIYDVAETDLPEDNVISLIAWRDSEDNDGRVYTITVTVYDAEGLSDSSIIEVVVPHDQGKRVK